MKKMRIVLLISGMSVASLCAAAQIADEISLAYKFHQAARDCETASEEELYAKGAETLDFMSKFTGAQILEAVTFKVDGKDPIEIAEASMCGICGLYAKMLEMKRDQTSIMVELGAGNLTEKEFFENAGLAKEFSTLTEKMWDEDYVNQREMFKRKLYAAKKEREARESLAIITQ